MQQAKIQQNRQSILITAQKIARVDIAMDQSLAMENAQHGEELTQQQQHFAATKHQLTLAPLLLNLPKAGSFLPLPHQPKRIQFLQQASEAWDQRVKHRLHRRPQLAKPLLRLRILKLPQCHRRIGGQHIGATPKLPLRCRGVCRQTLIQAVALSQQRADHKGIA